MRQVSGSTLPSRAVLLAGGILVIALALDAVVGSTLTTARYRQALLAAASARTASVRADIGRGLDFGLPLGALPGIGDRLHHLAMNDADKARAEVLDAQGKVLYAADRSLENTTPADRASKTALAATAPLIQCFRDRTGRFCEQVFPLVGPGGNRLGVFRVAIPESAWRGPGRILLALAAAIGLAGIVGMVLLLGGFLDRRTTRPLAAVTTAAEGLAAGDLTHAAAVRGDGEFAPLGNTLAAMAANLRGMLQKIAATGGGLNEATAAMTTATDRMSEGARVQQDATEQTASVVNEMVASIKGVAENTQDMSRAATDISSSAAQMASSIEEVARSAVALAAAVEDTAASIEEMTSSIKQVSENTDALSTSADETSASITEMSASVKEVEQRARDSARLAEQVSRAAAERGMAAAEESIRGMQNIKNAVEATAAVVNRLGKRSQEIGQILKVIDEVTDQTGLLALNAAILAAQAGEHGKGFAVVAEEIKDLAERTAASTQEIATLIASVRDETAESVQAMDRGLAAVEAGVDLAGVAREVLVQVTAEAQQAAETARAIEKTTAEQAKGVALITETAGENAAQVEQIARALQEQRKGTERIAQAAEQMREITRQVKTATHEQSASSRLIAASVESVTAQAGQIARSATEQSQGAQQISDAVTRIQQITQDTVDLSIELEMAVQTLTAKAEELRTELTGFTF